MSGHLKITNCMLSNFCSRIWKRHVSYVTSFLPRTASNLSKTAIYLKQTMLPCDIFLRLIKIVMIKIKKKPNKLANFIVPYHFIVYFFISCPRVCRRL